MAYFVVDLMEKSLSEFVSDNELTKGDVIEFTSPSLLYMFSLDREHFKLDDPDNIGDEDILSINDTLIEYYPRIVFEYNGYKHFDDVVMFGDDVPTIYGVISFFTEDGERVVNNNIFHFLAI